MSPDRHTGVHQTPERLFNDQANLSPTGSRQTNASVTPSRRGSPPKDGILQQAVAFYRA